MNKFDDIEIPESIDEVTKKAIKRGRNKKYRNKRINKIASVLVIGGVGLCIGFPVVVKALPNLEIAITSFIESVLPESHSSKLIDKNGVNNMIAKDKNAIVTLEKTLLDSNIFIANMIVESDFLKQYEESDLEYSLYANIFVSIGDKDNLVGSGADIKKIDDNKANIVVSAYLGNTEIQENTEININMKSLEISSNEWKSKDVKELKGDWSFSYNIEKENPLNVIEVKDDIEINGKIMTFESIEITPLASYIRLTADENIDNKWGFARYKIIDNNGKSYSYSNIDGHTDENGWNFTLAIYDDLSDIESLSITPYTEDTVIQSKIHGQDTIKLTTVMELDSKIEDVIISRDVEKRDLEVDTKPAYKYEGEKISYHLDIDKERSFYKIDELIGRDIKVGNQSSVTIKDIKVDDKNTTIVLKINGDYNNLSQIVLFDEDMMDTYSGIYVTHKGKWPSNSHWGNRKDTYYSSGEATFIIDKIDINKKYKLAVPLQKDINLNPNHTMYAKIK